MEEEQNKLDKAKVNKVLDNIGKEMIAKNLTNEESLYVFSVLCKAIIQAGDDNPGLRDLMKELIDSL
jgi:hypothetical protein